MSPLIQLTSKLITDTKGLYKVEPKDLLTERMETSTPVQSYHDQHSIIDEDTSLSPVTLSGQDTSSGTSVEQDTNQSPTRISGDIKVLEIIPAKSESECLDGRKVLYQTRDLTRALTGHGINPGPAAIQK